MGPEQTIGLVALAWLVVSFLLMARSIRRGRNLAEALATRHPEQYEALGRPRPGYFDSVRRARFSQFVGRREFQNLADGSLVEECEAYRKSEARLIVSLLTSGVVVAVLVVCLRHAS